MYLIPMKYVPCTNKICTSNTDLFAKTPYAIFFKFSSVIWINDSQQLPSSGSKDQVTGEEPRTYGDKLRDLANLADTLSKIPIFFYFFLFFIHEKYDTMIHFPDCSMSQLAVAWCLKNDTVNCLLLGASSVEQFKENIHALQVNYLVLSNEISFYLYMYYTEFLFSSVVLW